MTPLVLVREVIVLRRPRPLAWLGAAALVTAALAVAIASVLGPFLSGAMIRAVLF